MALARGLRIPVWGASLAAFIIISHVPEQAGRSGAEACCVHRPSPPGSWVGSLPAAACPWPGEAHPARVAPGAREPHPAGGRPAALPAASTPAPRLPSRAGVMSPAHLDLTLRFPTRVRTTPFGIPSPPELPAPCTAHSPPPPWAPDRCRVGGTVRVGPLRHPVASPVERHGRWTIWSQDLPFGLFKFFFFFNLLEMHLKQCVWVFDSFFPF